MELIDLRGDSDGAVRYAEVYQNGGVNLYGPGGLVSLGPDQMAELVAAYQRAQEAE